MARRVLICDAHDGSSGFLVVPAELPSSEEARAIYWALRELGCPRRMRIACAPARATRPRTGDGERTATPTE